MTTVTYVFIFDMESSLFPHLPFWGEWNVDPELSMPNELKGVSCQDNMKLGNCSLMTSRTGDSVGMFEM
jgi:hypothetical protein